MAINVFNYLDYKEFLEAYFQEFKSKNRKISHRSIAQIVGSSSVGWFSDVIKGRRKLQGDTLSRLLEWMKLDINEEEYFDLLVRFNQAETMVEKNRLYKHILSKAVLESEELEKESFQYFSEWHHAVIREYIATHGFTGDYTNLHKQITPSIKIQELKESIQLLIDLKLITKNANGSFTANHVHLKKKKTSSSLTFRNYIRAASLVGLEQLDSIPKEERDFSALTISLTSDELESIRAELKSLRNKIKLISEGHEDHSTNKDSSSRIYQCVFQVFPNTY